MADLAVLGLEIRSDGAVKATSDLDKLSAAASKAEKATDNAGRTSEQASQRMGNGSKAVERLLQAIAKVERAVRDQNAALGNMGGAMARAEAQMQAASGAAQNIAMAVTQAATASASASAGIAKAGSAAQAANQNFEAMARSAQGASSVMARINSATGVSLPMAGGGRTEDIAAYGKALDELRARYNPLAAIGQQYAKTVGEIREAHRVGAIGVHEMDAAIETAGSVASAQQAVYSKLRDRIDIVGGTAKLTGDQMRNMSFQINDAATMALSGASAFQILATQGGQVFQVLQEGPAGVRGSLRAIGAGFLDLVGNINPVALGIGGVALAVGGLALVMRKKFEPLADVIKRQKDQVEDLADAYGLVNDAADAYARRPAAVTDFQVDRRTEKDLTRFKRDAASMATSLGNAALLATPEFDEMGNVISGAAERFPQLVGIIERFNATVKAGRPDVRGLNEELAETGRSTPIAELKQFIETQLAANAALEEEQGLLQRNNMFLDQRSRAILASTSAYDELLKLTPNAASDMDRLNAAYANFIETATTSTQIEAANRALAAGVAELSRDAIQQAEEASNRLANLSLSPDARSLAEVRQSYAAQISELERTNGAEEALAAKRRERDAALSAATIEITRAEDARRAGYELDLQAVTARTAEEKALIAAERERIGLIAEGYSETEASARAQEAATLSLAAARQQLSEATRQQSEATNRQIEQAQLEYDLIGQSAGEVARLQAEFQMLAQAKDAAAAAGFDVPTVTLTESMRDQAAEIGRLTEATQRLNFERDILFERQQATRSPENQQIAAELRSMGVEYDSAQGRADAAQLRLNNRLHETNDLIGEMKETGKSAFFDLVDAIGSGESALKAFANAFAGIGRKMSEAGLDKIMNALSGSASPVAINAGTGGLGGILGFASQAVAQVSRPYTGPQNVGSGVSYGPSAPVSPVSRAPLADLPASVTGAGFSSSRANAVVGQSVPVQMWNFFADKGLASHQIAGILGNAKAESNFIPNGKPGDGGNAFGLFQWNDRRHKLFESIGGKQNLGDVNGQLEFAWKELQTSESKAYNALLKATNVTQATEAFLGFERPSGYPTGVRNSHNYSGRVRFAEEAYREYGSDVASSTNGGVRDFSPVADPKVVARGVSDGMTDFASRTSTSAQTSPWNWPGPQMPAAGSSTGYAIGSSADPWNGMRAVTPTTGGQGAAAGAVQGGGLFGGQGMQGLGVGLGAFAQGMQSGSPLSGGLGGALAGIGAGFGPLGILASGAAGLLGGLFGGGDKAEREAKHREQAAQWEAMQPEYEQWQRSLTGDSTGQLREMFSSFQGNWDTFREAGGAAWKYGENNSTEDFTAVAKKMYDRVFREMQEFQDAFADIAHDLEKGAGLDGPFARGRASARAMQEQIQGFLDDIAIAFGSADNGLTGGPNEAAAKEWEGRRNEALDTGRKAAVDYALSMIYAGDAMSQTEETLQGLKGMAQGAIPVIVKLGKSTDEAMDLVYVAMTAATDALREEFVGGLEAGINDLLDKGYVNDFKDLLAEQSEAMKDAALLGADQALVTQYFTLAAQSIVDGAELTGAAFTDLVTLFPELSGVVTEFSAATANAVKRTAEQIADLKASYGDRVFASGNDTGTQAGALAAFERAAAREREAEVKAGGQVIVDLESALTAERTKIVRDYEAQRAEAISGYMDRLFEAQNEAATEVGALAAFERQAARDRQAEVKAGGQGMRELEAALAAERLGIVEDFAAQVKARELGYQNRFFTATNDTTGVSGQLAAFDRAAEQERLAEIEAGGAAMLDLERALAAERAKIAKDGTKEVLDAERQRYDEAKSFLDGLSRSLSEFVDGLKAGADSPLSPKDRLAEAQKQYDEQLALAKSGDRDAATGLTGYFSNLLDASKGYNASSSPFQSTFDKGVEQLEALPDQVSAEQFIVDAIDNSRDALDTAVREAADSLIPQFDKLDTSLNGVLDFQEFRAGMKGTEEELQRIFGEIDINGDREVSRLESILASDGLTRSAVVAAITSGPAATAQLLGQHFEDLDFNVSGSLSLAELRSAFGGTEAELRKVFAEIDINGSGTISRLESLLSAEGLTRSAIVDAVKGGPREIASALAPHFARIDLDSSGGVDFGELQDVLGGLASDDAIRGIIRELDSNNDGQISRLELIAEHDEKIREHTYAERLETARQGDVLKAIRDQTGTQWAAGDYQSKLLDRVATSTAQMSEKLSAAVTSLQLIRSNVRDSLIRSGGKGYMEGGYTGGSSPFEVRGPVHGQEYVVTAEATRRMGVPFLDSINDNRMRMPAIPVPMAIPSGGDSGAMLTEMRALRAEVAKLREESKRGMVASTQDIVKSVEGVRSSQDEGNRLGKLRAA